MAPQIPYINLPLELPIPLLSRFFPDNPPSLKLFGAIVATGVYIGILIATRRAKQRRIPAETINSFIWWILVSGFFFAHVLDDVFYHPDAVAKNPLHILMLWEGISSYGGFIGGVIGALGFRYRYGKPIMNLVEVIHSSFPVAWVIGRLGCATVHDHPGLLTTSWIAVKYPNVANGWGRYDLGLYEMVLAIPLAVAFLILWHRKFDRPLGFYTGWMCIYYAPVRFFLDFLRESEDHLRGAGDPRYGSLTPAQWACFAVIGVGLYFLNMARKGGSSMEPEPEPEPALEAAPAPPKRGGDAPRPKRRRKKPAAS